MSAPWAPGTDWAWEAANADYGPQDTPGLQDGRPGRVQAGQRPAAGASDKARDEYRPSGRTMLVGENILVGQAVKAEQQERRKARYKYAGLSVDERIDRKMIERANELEVRDAAEEYAEHVRRHARTIRAIPASQITMKRLRWLWKDKIPLGELCLFAGREGAAKSQAAIALAAQVTRGEVPGELDGQPRDVIIVAGTEDSWETVIAPRLRAAGAGMDRVHKVFVEHIGSGTTMRLMLVDVPGLDGLIREKNAALVILDPLLSMFSGRIDTHKAADVRKELEPVADLAHETMCTVVALMHFNKTGGGADIATLLGGSHAFRDLARSIVGFARDSETTGVMSCGKSNLGRNGWSYEYSIEPYRLQVSDGETEVSRFQVGAETQRHVEDLLAEGPGRASASACDFLRRVLTDGPVPSADVQARAAAEGFSARTLASARKRLAIQAVKLPSGEWQMSL